MKASERLGRQAAEELFSRLSAIDEGDHRALRELARELRARIEIEERMVYPIARAEGDRDGASCTLASAVLARLECCDDPKLAALLDLIGDSEEVELASAGEELERLGDEIARRVEHAMIASTIGGRRARRERVRSRMAARRR